MAALEARSAVAEVELARLPFRPDQRGSFRWHVDPRFELPELLQAVGVGLRACLTDADIAATGRRLILQIDLDRPGGASIAFQRIDEEN